MLSTAYSPLMSIATGDSREIVLTFTGQVNFVQTTDVVIKAGNGYEAGTISIPISGGTNTDSTCTP